MPMRTNPGTNDRGPRVPRGRAGFVSLCAALLLAVYGAREWWGVVGITAGRDSAGGADGGLLLFAFFLLCLPIAVGAGLLMFTFGWRSGLSKVVLAVAAILLVSAFVVLGVGAS